MKGPHNEGGSSSEIDKIKERIRFTLQVSGKDAYVTDVNLKPDGTIESFVWSGRKYKPMSGMYNEEVVQESPRLKVIIGVAGRVATGGSPQIMIVPEFDGMLPFRIVSGDLSEFGAFESTIMLR